MKEFDIITPEQLSLLETITTELSLSRSMPLRIRLKESLTVIEEVIKRLQKVGWFCKLETEPYGQYLLTLSNKCIIN